jgi:integration host factor subunit beta
MSAARDVVDTVLGAIEEALLEGGRVELRGFGSFRTRVAKGYTGHNPMTGEPIEVPERRVAVFKPARALAEAVAASEDARQCES